MTKTTFVRKMRHPELRKDASRVLALALSLIFLLSPVTAAQAATDSGKAAKSSAGLTPAIPVFPLIPKTAESVEKVDKLLKEGGRSFRKNQMSEALEKYQEAYGLTLEMKYSVGQGRALVAMSRLYLAQGKKVKAKQLAENALEVLAGANDPKRMARARVQAAHCYMAFDNTVWAAQQLDLALKDVSDMGATDPSDAAGIVLLGAEILKKAGKYKDSIRFYKRAASFYRQANNARLELITRVYLSNMLMQLGFTTVALEEAEEAIATARESKLPDVQAVALAMKASCQYRLGLIAEARKNCENALFKIREFKDTDPLLVARMKAGYGMALAASGELDGAEVMLEKALPVLQKKEAGIVPSMYSNVLGVINVEKRNYSAANSQFKQALDFEDISSVKRPLQRASILINLAAANSRSGKFGEAKTNLLMALEIVSKKRNLTYYGRVLAGLAEVCMDLKQPTESEKYLKKAIEIGTTIKDDAALWRDYTIKANLQLSSGDEKGAKESLKSALSFFRSPQSITHNSIEHLWFPSTRGDLGYELVSLLVWEGSFDSAILAAEQLKEERFIRSWTISGALVKKEERNIYKDFAGRYARLHAAELGTTPDKLVEEWKNWLVRFNQLAVENSTLAGLIAPVPMPAAKLKAALADRNRVIVDYLIGRHSTLVFSITPDGKIFGEEVQVGRAKLERQVKSLLASSAQRSGQADARLLGQLYDELIPESVREILPVSSDRVVTIVPDGVLFNLPFAALVDGSGKYFVEKHTLTLAASLAAVIGTPPPYARDMYIAVAGGSAGAETRRLEKVMPPGSVTDLSARGSKLSGLEDEARKNSVIHVPARVSLKGRNTFTSRIPLSADGKNSIQTSRLFGLDLPSDLAVWSNSSVAAEDLDGEAVSVLSRGLGYAGVRNVLLSLWADDNADRTSQLMEFYKATQLGLSEARSLRKAQLLAISRNESPRKWAYFQLIGPGN